MFSSLVTFSSNFSGFYDFFKLTISLLFMMGFMFWFLNTDSFYLFYVFLFLNSFVSMIILIVDSYDHTKKVYNCFSSKIFCEILIFLIVGVTFWFVDSIDISFFSIFGKDFISYSALILMSIYTLIGCFGFWIYWVMGTSCFVSLYFHTSGFVLMGCFMLRKFMTSSILLGVVNNPDSSFFDMPVFYFLGIVSAISFFIFILCFLLEKDLKKSMGFYTASSSSFLFLMSLLHGDIFYVYFVFLAVVKIILFSLFKFLVHKKFSEECAWSVIAILGIVCVYLSGFLLSFDAKFYQTYDVSIYIKDSFSYYLSSKNSMQIMKMFLVVFKLFSFSWASFYSFFFTVVVYDVFSLDLDFYFFFFLYQIFCFFQQFLFILFFLVMYMFPWFFSYIFFIYLGPFYFCYFLIIQSYVYFNVPVWSDFYYKFFFEKVFSVFLTVSSFHYYFKYYCFYFFSKIHNFVSGFEMSFLNFWFCYIFKWKKSNYIYNFCIQDLLFIFLILMYLFLIFF